MFTKAEIYGLFPMRNCFPIAYEAKEFDDLFTLSIVVKAYHSNMTTTIQLDVPKLDKNGIVDVGGSLRQICSVLRPNPMFNRRCMDINFTYVLPPHKVVLEWIGKSINYHLKQFYVSGTVVEPELAQIRLHKFIRASRISHAVKGLAKDYPGKIYLDLEQRTPDERMPFNTRGILDWTSISSSSNRCGGTMYPCSSVEFNEHGIFTKRGLPYCDILNDMLVLPEYSRRRTSASNFKAAMELVKPDKPLCYADTYKKGLQGKHLFTVHAIIPGVYKEQIVMSESAAKKMTSIIPEQQAIIVPAWCKGSLKQLVKLGEDVKPGQPIFEYMDGEHPVQITAHPHRIARITDIKLLRSRVYSKECTKVIVKYERIHLLKSGDKIINRHGNKGIVRIIPDNEMVQVSGRPAEVVVNALATARRRNPGQIVEAMVNHICADPSNGAASVPHFDGNSLSAAILPMLKKQKHEYNGQVLHAWSGKVFWMILDKFSHMTRSHVAKRKTDLDGIYANSGKRSGTRVYLSVMQIMLSKGMEPFLDRLIEDNMTGIDKIQKYIYCMVNG